MLLRMNEILSLLSVFPLCGLNLAVDAVWLIDTNGVSGWLIDTNGVSRHWFVVIVCVVIARSGFQYTLSMS